MDAGLAQEGQARGEPSQAVRVGRAGLEPIGHLLGMRFILAASAGPALAQRPKIEPWADIERPRPHGSEEALVTREGDHIQARSPNVDIGGPHGLRGVHEDGGPGIVRGP